MDRAAQRVSSKQFIKISVFSHVKIPQFCSVMSSRILNTVIWESHRNRKLQQTTFIGLFIRRAKFFLSPLKLQNDFVTFICDIFCPIRYALRYALF